MSWELFNFNYRTVGVPSAITGEILDALVLQKPDILILMDDTGTPSTVLDLGQKQYTNVLTGSITFGQSPVADDSGTSGLFGSDGLISIANVQHEAHVHVIIGLIPSTEQTILSNGDVTVGISASGFVTFNGVSSTILRSSKAIVFQVEASTLTAWGDESTTPGLVTTITNSGLTSTVSMTGSGVTWDYYSVIRNENANIDAILEAIGAAISTPNVTTGIVPVNITPGTEGFGFAATNDFSNVLFFTGGHFDVTSDGRIIYFPTGLTSAMYYSEDFGDTWSGPLDKSLQILARVTVIAATYVGNVRHVSGSRWVAATSTTSNNAAGYAYTDDNGATWTSVRDNIQRSATFQVTSSGGMVFPGRRSQPTAINLAYVQYRPSPFQAGGGSITPTVQVWTSEDNGNGSVAFGDGTYGLFFGANAKAVTVSATGSVLTANWDGFTLTAVAASRPGDGFMVGNNSTQWTSSGVSTTDPMNFTNEFGFTVAGGGRHVLTAISGDGSAYIRGWTFGSAGVERDRLYLESNRDGVVGNWTDKAFVFLSPPRGNLPNANLGLFYTKSPVPGLMFTTYVANSDQARPQLIRYEYPGTTFQINNPNPPPSPSSQTIALFNFESGAPAGIVQNEAAAAKGDLQILGGTLGTAGTKFGIRALQVPPKGADTFYLPATQPAWRNGLEGLDVGLQDWCVEAWVTPLDDSGACYLGSNQAYTLVDGVWRRYGGITVSMSGSAGNGKASVFLGGSFATALAGGGGPNLGSGNAAGVQVSGLSEWDPAGTNHVRVSRKGGDISVFVGGRKGALTIPFGALAIRERGVLTVSPARPGPPLKTKINSVPVFVTPEPFRMGSYLTTYDGGTKLAATAQSAAIDGFRFVLGDFVSDRNFAVPTAPYTE